MAGFTLVIRSAKSARDVAEVKTGVKGYDGAIIGDRPAYHVSASNVPTHVVAGDPDRFV